MNYWDTDLGAVIPESEATFDRLTPVERAQYNELVAAARETVDALRRLHADFAEAIAGDASSNDITQLLDDFLVDLGYPTVLYAGGTT